MSSNLEADTRRSSPRSWTCRPFPAVPLKRLLTAPPCYGVLVPERHDGEGGVPMIRILDISDGKVSHSDLVAISPEQSSNYGRTILEEGDLVMSVVGTIGRTFLVGPCEAGANISRALARLQIKPETDRHFLNYWIQSLDCQTQIGLYRQVTAQPVLNMGQLANFVVPVPSPPKQRAIAAFLDRETARIDELIVKHGRLLSATEHKATRTISDLVTRGVKKNALMRETGIPWIGMVPAHWEVLPMKREWTVIDCKHKTATYVDEGIPIVSTTEVKPGRLDLGSTRLTSFKEYLDLSEGRTTMRGDIIYSRNASVGSAAYVDTDQHFCMGQDVCLITSLRHNQLFLTYQLNSRVVLSQVDMMTVGATFKRINVQQIKNIVVTCPPRGEQDEIASRADETAAEIGRARRTFSRVMARLQERRQALITAAVTGQIEVSEGIGRSDEAL
jgi:type I restriction enzyme S subunit